MTEKLSKYDPAIALVDDEEVAAFISDALETGDAAFIAKSLGVVARAKGMAEIAVRTGLSREQLYRSFSAEGNPTLKTTLAVMKALGVDLTAKVHTEA
jgi:probable addiction module antidote protein